MQNWAGLRSIAMIICTRIINGKETREVRFYFFSLVSNTERIILVVRKHWSVENQLHWVLDVALNEDHCVRKDHLAVLRHPHRSQSAQTGENCVRGGIHAKQLQADWDEEYILKILATAN